MKIEDKTSEQLRACRERIYAVRTKLESHRKSFGEEWGDFFTEIEQDLSLSLRLCDEVENTRADNGEPCTHESDEKVGPFWRCKNCGEKL